MYNDNTNDSECSGSLIVLGAASPAPVRLYYRVQELWDALPDDLPESVYARLLDVTNECLAADDRIGLEAAYATVTTRQVAA